MAGKGPAPKPTALRILSGSRGRRPNKDEPKPTRGAPSIPEYLDDEAKAEWNRIVPELDRLGVVTIVDRAALTHYCLSHASVIEAAADISKRGTIIEVDVFARQTGVKVGTRLVVNPAVRLRNDSLRIVRQYLAEFGLTPASRVRVKGNGDQNQAKDPLTTLIEKANQARRA